MSIEDPQSLPVGTWVARDHANLSARARNILLGLHAEQAPGWRRIADIPRCSTLRDVAMLHGTRILRAENCGRKTLRSMQESLARAGVVAIWFAGDEETD